MMAIGAMQMPKDFRYKKVFMKGMPVHEKWDSFRIKHPAMPTSRWAKIFSPFDALKGFDEAIGSKRNVFSEKIELDEDGKRKLDFQLNILRNYTFNSRMAWENHIMVKICSFHQENGSSLGKYTDTEGMVLAVDEINECITLNTDGARTVIYFEDILKITPEKEDLFDIIPEWDAI